MSAPIATETRWRGSLHRFVGHPSHFQQLTSLKKKCNNRSKTVDSLTITAYGIGMTTNMRPMEAMQSAYCLSNKEARLVLDMTHGNLHGQTTAEACVDIFGPQGAGHKTKQAKVLTAYNAFVQMGKEAFWAAAFKSASETKAAVAHIKIERREYDGPTLPRGWSVDDNGRVLGTQATIAAEKGE